jgi:Fe-S-cluster-containing dehydrogenase component
VACKAVNNVPVGSFWNKTLRIGPNPKSGGSGQYPDVEMYFLNVSCQHCVDPECVKVCPTGASHKRDDGTVQVDKSKCIGCQFCVMACPYAVRYLNEDEGVVEKCTLCEQKTANGELPQCVSQCCGMARWFGDMDAGIDGFKGPRGATLKDYLLPYGTDQLHSLPDVGNKPALRYILRDMKWQGGGK